MGGVYSIRYSVKTTSFLHRINQPSGARAVYINIYHSNYASSLGTGLMFASLLTLKQFLETLNPLSSRQHFRYPTWSFYWRLPVAPANRSCPQSTFSCEQLQFV